FEVPLGIALAVPFDGPPPSAADVLLLAPQVSDPSGVPPRRIAFSADGAHLAVLVSDGSAFVWSLEPARVRAAAQRWRAPGRRARFPSSSRRPCTKPRDAAPSGSAVSSFRCSPAQPVGRAARSTATTRPRPVRE